VRNREGEAVLPRFAVLTHFMREIDAGKG
jgi:hypothetical protein